MKSFLVLPVLFVLLSGCLDSGGQQAGPLASSESSPQPTSESTGLITGAITASSGVFTLAQVAEHASASDCWCVVDGKVYDLTELIPAHPGGAAIVQACGKDATALFETRLDGKPHPEKAQDKLSSFQIGVLKEAG